MAIQQRITSNLWFDTQAEEAVKFYTSVFKNSRIGRISHYGKEGQDQHHMPEGTVLTVQFWLDDQEFLALNGGPVFKFNEAISFIVNCKDQDEVDYYWENLSQGGDKSAQQCGWLKDKFGLSWQIVPTLLQDMITDEDQRKADRVMKELFKMKKLDIATLKAAYGKKEMSAV
jgi:predicted 3-demethylubiquinone-9 3-methyltransferase (glyoxalase superfamily)